MRPGLQGVREVFISMVCVTDELLIRLVGPPLEEAEPIIRHAAHLWAAARPWRLLRGNGVDSSGSNSEGEES